MLNIYIFFFNNAKYCRINLKYKKIKKIKKYIYYQYNYSFYIYEYIYSMLFKVKLSTHCK